MWGEITDNNCFDKTTWKCIFAETSLNIYTCELDLNGVNI